MIPFVGREEEIEEVKKIISEKEKAVICIAGNTGMGKTEFLRVLEKNLAEDRSVITGWHRVESKLEEYHPFLETLSKVIKDVDEKEKVKSRLEWLQKALSKNFWGKTKDLVGAGLKDATGTLLKTLKVNVDVSNVSAKVEKILNEASKEWSVKSTLDKLLVDHKEEVITTYNRFLRSISEFSPLEQKFILIFDQIEDTSEVFQEFLKSVAKNLPEKFYLIFTINDEIPAGVEFLKRHKADLQYYETCTIELKGLSNAEIRKLIELMTKVYKAPDEVEIVRKATDGRPLMIIPWIQSKDFDQAKIDEQKLRVYGYFDDNYWALNPETRKLVITLSILPFPLKKGISDYAGIMGIDNHICGELIHNLESQNIFKRYDNKPWFSHALIKNFIFENMDDPVKKESAKQIIKFLRKEYPKEIKALELAGLRSTYTALLPYTDELKETYSQNIALGDYHFDLSSYQVALDYYQRARKAAEKLKEKEKIGHALNNIGQVYNAWGKYDQALEYYEKDLKICQETGDRNGEGISLNNIGGIYDAWDKYDQAIGYYEKALKILEEVGDRENEGVSLNNIGLIYETWGKYDKAIKYYMKDLKICQKAGDRHGEGVSLNNIGDIYRTWGKYDQALEYYDKSLKISQEIGDREGEGVSLNNIGMVYDAWGKYDQAIVYYQKSLKITQVIGDREQEGVCLNNIGDIYRTWGKYDQALEYYEKDLKICQETGDRHGEGVSLNNIGMVYDAWGKYDQALEYMTKSLNIFKEIRVTTDVEETRENIKMIKSEMKNKKEE